MPWAFNVVLVILGMVFVITMRLEPANYIKRVIVAAADDRCRYAWGNDYFPLLLSVELGNGFDSLL